MECNASDSVCQVNVAFELLKFIPIDRQDVDKCKENKDHPFKIQT